MVSEAHQKEVQTSIIRGLLRKVTFRQTPALTRCTEWRAGVFLLISKTMMEIYRLPPRIWKGCLTQRNRADDLPICRWTYVDEIIARFQNRSQKDQEERGRAS